jgi:FeS assembly SUF system protein
VSGVDERKDPTPSTDPAATSGAGAPPPASPPPAASTPAAPAPADATESRLASPPPDLREQVVETLQSVYDPEIPVNVYDLGLVYDVDVSPEGDVAIRMTLTSPACPVAGTLPPEVEQKVRAIPGVRSAKVDVVWDPPWDRSKLSEAARLQLGFY